MYKRQEKRLLTYPRTDSKYITSDMEGSTKELITGLCAALPFMHNERIGFDVLYDTLTLPEHHIGLRKGLIPIYLAVVLHEYKQQVGGKHLCGQ